MFGDVEVFGEPRTAQNTLILEASTSLPSSCTVLTCTDPNNPFGGEQSFYIVGTAHVSTESCEDVRKVIKQVKPEVQLPCSVLDQCSLLIPMPGHPFASSSSSHSRLFLQVVFLELCSERRGILTVTKQEVRRHR